MAEIIHEEDYSLAAGPQGQITKMEAILTRFPRDSFNWVVGPFDEALVPLLQTADQRDRDEIKGIAFDGEPVAYQSIRSGGFASGDHQLGAGMGCLGWGLTSATARSMKPRWVSTQTSLFS